MEYVNTVMPSAEGLYYDGAWHAPREGRKSDVHSPATGAYLATVAEASAADIPAVMASAQRGFETWRQVAPAERAKILRELAAILRKNKEELALLDAHDCGNPVAEMRRDLDICVVNMEFYAGLVTEMKGTSVPMGPDSLSFSVREPHGIVARISPFNHPLIFSVGRLAAPLAAGNSIVVKPPEQAPLSALRAAELFHGVLPPGVLNVVPGDRDLGAALVSDPRVAMIALTGSVATGKAVMRLASDGLKRVLLELGGKNALVALPDMDPDKVASAVVRGMNFTWCGQSCGSTSRAFLHEDIYDEVLKRIPEHVAKYRPGLPDDPRTTMGSLVSKQQYEKVLRYIEIAKAEGARLICGGRRSADPALKNGFFVEPTVFADVTMDMKVARDEIFGPVLSVLRWRDEDDVMRQANQVEYGLTFSVWTNDVTKAHRFISKAQAGFCWINEVSRHAFGSPFGGYKQSGIGREECLDELLSYTQEKNIFINLKP